MAVVGHLHKVVFGGRLAGTESWSCSLHFLNPDPGVIVIDGLFASAIGLWFDRATSKISLLAFLDYIKVNELNPASIPSSVPGKPNSAPFTRYLSETDVNELVILAPRQGDQAAEPPQISYAVSTVTGFLRGPAHQGRFYPPCGHTTLATDGRLPVLDAKEMSQSAAQLITDLNGANTGSCVVYSGVGQVTREITGCRVGRVADTQRRRRRNLIEQYEETGVS